MIDYTKYITGKKELIDMTKLMLDPVIFDSLIDDMCKPFLNKKIDTVVAIDAMGFVFGSRIAEKLGVGLVLIRKGGKIGVDKKSISFTDYSKTEKSLEMATIALKGGERVLVADEWSETGTQLKTAIKLVENCGGKVIGISCVSVDNAVKKDFTLSKYMIHSVL
jgi:adenine phosphoribosyltransferase